MQKNSLISKVCSVANSLVGTRWRNGQTAQCANFVRYVFEQAGVEIGIAKKPEDFSLIPNLPQGASYANSFAGDDVGRKVGLSNLQAGDVALFRNTYGDYPGGTITHVGIMVNDSYMVHRPTSDRPVEKIHKSASIFKNCFHSGRRPLSYFDIENVAKFFAHGSKSSAFFDGEKKDGILKFFAHHGEGRALGTYIGGEYSEFQEAYIDISFAEGAIYSIALKNNQYKITRPDGGVSENAPAELVFVSRAGVLEGHYNLGGETTDLRENAKIKAIFRKKV